MAGLHAIIALLLTFLSGGKVMTRDSAMTLLQLHTHTKKAGVLEDEEEAEDIALHGGAVPSSKEYECDEWYEALKLLHGLDLGDCRTQCEKRSAALTVERCFEEITVTAQQLLEVKDTVRKWNDMIMANS